MNTDNELKNHLYFEFKINNDFSLSINETRGVVDGIDSVVRVFSNMVLPQIKEVMKTGKSQTILYNEKTDDWVYSNVKTFFSDFTLKLKIEKDDKNTYNGATSTDTIKKINKTFVCTPKIELYITSTSAVKCLQIFNFCIGHELTHCYDMLQYSLKNNELPNKNIMINNRYNNIKIAQNSVLNNYKAIGTMLYNLNRLERNAYISQLRQELIDNKEKLKDFKSTFDAIKTTQSYKKFLDLEKNINIILNGSLSDETKNELINYLNTIMNTKFTTYNQFVKYFVRRWYKWKKNYLSKASKIAYDVFSEYNQYLDGNNMSDSTIINQNGD